MMEADTYDIPGKDKEDDEFSNLEDDEDEDMESETDEMGETDDDIVSGEIHSDSEMIALQPESGG